MTMTSAAPSGGIFTLDFWKAAAERAITSAAGGALAGFTLDQLSGDALGALKACGVAALVAAGTSLLKGIAANAANGGLGPGLGSAEVTQPVIPVDNAVPAGTLPTERDDTTVTIEGDTYPGEAL